MIRLNLTILFLFRNLIYFKMMRKPRGYSLSADERLRSSSLVKVDYFWVNRAQNRDLNVSVHVRSAQGAGNVGTDPQPQAQDHRAQHANLEKGLHGCECVEISCQGSIYCETGSAFRVTWTRGLALEAKRGVWTLPLSQRCGEIHLLRRISVARAGMRTLEVTVTVVFVLFEMARSDGRLQDRVV